MPSWDCPRCGRRFARSNQGHECAPAMTLEEYFSSGPPHERAVFDAVLAHAESLGNVHVEPVSVGIFLKRDRSFAELRPKDRWVAVCFSLSRVARHRLITRKVIAHGGRHYHVANVAHPGELDDDLLALITEAFNETPG